MPAMLKTVSLFCSLWIVLNAAELRLAPPFDDAGQEYSGLTWHMDRTLIMLPQYPDGSLPVLQKSALQHALDTNTTLHPSQMRFDDHIVQDQISGYEGYEAIACEHNTVYTLIEARSFFGAMKGYLAKGILDAKGIVLHQLIEIPMPMQVSNYAFEAMSILEKHIYVLYEANGLRPEPVAYKIACDLSSVETVPLAAIDHRVTDMTAVSMHKAWVLNTYWTGDKKKLQTTEKENFGRLVELAVSGQGIRRTGKNMTINRGAQSYNWEGMVRFGSGFLVVTDRYPRTVLEYVEAY